MNAPPAPGRPWPLPDAAEPPAAPPRPPAVDSLTAVRGAAAVWVVLFHFSPDLYALFPATRALAPLIDRGEFAVPMFFVLSGYVLALNHAGRFGLNLTVRGAGAFYLRRLVRIYPLHLATLLGTAVMAVVGSRLGASLDPAGYGGKTFALNLLLLHAWEPHLRRNWNYPSWSISAEWFAYLLFPPLAAGLWRLGRRAVRAVAAASLAGMLAFYIWYWGRGAFDDLLSVVCPFTLGIAAWLVLDRGEILSRGPNRRRPPAWAAWAAAGSVPAAAYLGAWAAPDPAWRDLATAGLLTGLAATVAVLGAAGPDCPRAFRWGPLLALGEASYALYLTHAMAQKGLYTLLPASRFAESGWAARAGVALTYAATVALAAWLAQATVERRAVPWLRRRLTPRRPPSPPGPQESDQGTKR